MGLLSRLLFGKPPHRIEHPVFGEALLMSAKQGSYWEVETDVAGKPFTVVIETTDDQEPSQAQAEFFKKFTDDPDMAFSRASVLLVPEYVKWAREPFPTKWRDGFAFTGMSVPLDGDERNPWDLSFECLKNRHGHLFTCTFENGQPTDLHVDG